jgi:stage II sporulation protein D
LTLSASARRRPGFLLLLLWAAGCSVFSRQSPQGQTQTESSPVVSPTGGPSATPTPAPPKAGALVPVPADVAASGFFYRIGWKSDALEFVYGPPGQRWIVAAGGAAQVLRGTFRFRPEGKGVASYSVQVGAYSAEDVARRTLERVSAQFAVTGTVAFSADRGVYRVLVGSFADHAAADAFVEKARAAGHEGFVVEASAAASGSAAITMTGEDGVARRFASPVDVFPADAVSRVLLEGKPYRGSVRILINARGALNIVNRVDLEDYLYGVVPAEMGPKRFDELEALKAQAVAARTYALAHRGQFESEGFDICATPKCQVYSALSAEDPLSTAAVDATRGLVLAYGGHFADALFISTCGGRTENVENVFGETPVPYLVSVECGELATTTLPGAPRERARAEIARSGLEWRGYVVRRHAPRQRAVRAAELATAQQWAGIKPNSPPPATLAPTAVYPSLLAAFALTAAREVHLTPSEQRYFAEPPAAAGQLGGPARDAYEFLLRFRFGAGEPLPPPDQTLTEEVYAGLLFSAALRLGGVTEASGKFLLREGSNVWVKTGEGRQGLAVDPELPLARRVGDRFFSSSFLNLRAGDRLRWWKRGSRVLALWVEMDAAGPSFERDSSWTEWVRRISGKELARRMSGRVAGAEVREITITGRSQAGRAIEMRVVTDVAEVTLKRFDVRQALELPEMLFTVQRARDPQGELEFVFLGRGWGHGVGLCQNGAYGMALAGTGFDQILRHYYSGVEIAQASSVAAAPPSTR